MSRIRPASNLISYHKWTKQFYVTRAGKRIYLGSGREQVLKAEQGKNKCAVNTNLKV